MQSTKQRTADISKFSFNLTEHEKAKMPNAGHQRRSICIIIKVSTKPVHKFNLVLSVISWMCCCSAWKPSRSTENPQLIIHRDLLGKRERNFQPANYSLVIPDVSPMLRVTSMAGYLKESGHILDEWLLINPIFHWMHIMSLFFQIK